MVALRSRRRKSTRRLRIESLETRRMLAADRIADRWIVIADVPAQSLTLRREADRFVIRDAAGVPRESAPAAGLNAFHWVGSAAADTFTIDFAGGPLPDAIEISGGGPAGLGDRVVLVGANTTAVTTKLTDANAGTIDVIAAGGRRTGITIAGIASVRDELPTMDRAFRVTTSSPILTLADDAATNDRFNRLTLAGGLTHAFIAPSASLAVATESALSFTLDVLDPAAITPRIQVQSSDRDDVINVRATSPGSDLVIPTGGGNDVVNLTSTASGTAANPDGDLTGNLALIRGPVHVDGGGHRELPTVTETVTARRSPTISATVSTTIVAGDRVHVSDFGGASAGSFRLAAGQLTQADQPAASISLNAIETLRLLTGRLDDSVLIESTPAASLVEVQTRGGDDSVTIERTGAGSITRIRTGAEPDSASSDRDTVHVRQTGDGSIIAIDTSPRRGGSTSDDNDEVTIDAIGANAGIVGVTGTPGQTGADRDTITLGAEAMAATVTPPTTATAAITLAAGDDADTFFVNEVFLAAVVDLRGQAGNDRFELRSPSVNLAGSLSRLNDDPLGAGLRDAVASTRQLLIDGGEQASQPRTSPINSGATVSSTGALGQPTLQGVPVGDAITVIVAPTANRDLDWRYVLTGPAAGVLATTRPLESVVDPTDPPPRRETGNEVFDALGIENVTLRSGGGDDVLTVTSRGTFDFANSGQIVRFDGGDGEDRLEARGGGGDDRITVGVFEGQDATMVIDPLQIAAVESIRLEGHDGDDHLVNNSATLSVIDGRRGNDVLVGGDVKDLLAGGSGDDFLYGRGGDDVLLSDQDFGFNAIVTAGGSSGDASLAGDLLEGGDQVTIPPGDLCIQADVDDIRNCEQLVDGGGFKDVLTWLRAQIVAEGAIDFDLPSDNLRPFLSAFGDVPSSVSVAEPSQLASFMATAGDMAPTTQMDVNGDGRTSALDALQVINELNRMTARSTAESIQAARDGTFGRQIRSFADVDGNGRVEALDALLIINALHRTPGIKFANSEKLAMAPQPALPTADATLSHRWDWEDEISLALAGITDEKAR